MKLVCTYTMEPAKVCQICLITGVRMYEVNSYPLKKYFDVVLPVDPYTKMLLPPYICYECKAHVTKYYFFKERCSRGHTALYNMLHMSGQIFIDQLTRMRQDLQLNSSLTTFNILNASLNISPEDGLAVECENSHEIKPEPDENAVERYIDEDTVKEEDGEYLYLPSPMVSSDDDEPLSTHKRNKEKEEFDVKLEEKQEIEEAGSLDVPVKRKRGRPKKTDKVKSKAKHKKKEVLLEGDLDENMDVSNYTTIIKLSTEQQLEEIMKRKESTNYRNATYRCNYCYKGFIETHAWEHHIAKHDPSAGDMECPICKIRFKNRRTLMKHSANHDKIFMCKACPYVSKTTAQAKQHQMWHKGVTYKCKYCDEVSTKWTSYLSHVRIKHPSEFVCGICGYSFVSRLGLTMHRTMMHKQHVEKEEEDDVKAEQSGLHCQECDVKFISVEAYKRHMFMSSKHAQSTDNTHGCRACGESFESGEALRLHHRAAHARKRPKNYGKRPLADAWPAPCLHCGDLIENARDYWTHFRRVHPDKNYPIKKDYVCDICGKSFRGNAFLVYHRRTHSEERLFRCGACPKAFHNRTNLHMHQRTHSDVRPHGCSVCLKAFKTKGALDRHARSHTGVKPYECEVCGKAFGQSNSRKLHVRTVHLKQPAPYVSRARLERRRARPDLPVGLASH